VGFFLFVNTKLASVFGKGKNTTNREAV
jgi:hypothetical protein